MATIGQQAATPFADRLKWHLGHHMKARLGYPQSITSLLARFREVATSQPLRACRFVAWMLARPPGRQSRHAFATRCIAVRLPRQGVAKVKSRTWCPMRSDRSDRPGARRVPSPPSGPCLIRDIDGQVVGCCPMAPSLGGYPPQALPRLQTWADWRCEPRCPRPTVAPSPKKHARAMMAILVACTMTGRRTLRPHEP